jgi:NitT/TauT family transport system substrate-binding protein
MTETRLGRASRRDFLARASALGGAALLGVSRPATAEPPPEIRRIRLIDTPAICRAPEYLAAELLRAEGFDDVQFTKLESGSGAELIAEGRADVTMWDVPGSRTANPWAGAVATRY